MDSSYKLMTKGKKRRKEKKENRNKEKNEKIEENNKIDRLKYPYEFAILLDADRILEETINRDELKVTLLCDNIKGTCLYATKNIQANEIIAYYKIRVFNQDKYKSPTNFIYAFSIYGPDNIKFDHLIGDIDLESIPTPDNNIPYWGHFINEPYRNQDINCRVDPNIYYNFTKLGKTKVTYGSYLIYKIIARRDIEPDEEITLDYGDEYDRDYDL